jgi:uncharacterized membrane protein YfcA
LVRSCWTCDISSKRYNFRHFCHHQGVGGGGIFVPVGNLLLNLGPKSATALSQASILGSSVGGVVLNLRNKHPVDPRRPVIDLDLVLLLAPMQMGGAVVSKMK